MSTIKLVVVDDHQLFREGVISLLSKKEDLEVVGEAENANGLWEILDQKKVHIVLIDISLPDMNGIEIISTAKEKYENVRFIALTMHAEGQYVIQAVKSGAHGYLIKNADEQELITAIKQVALGQKYFNSEISQLMITDMAIEGDESRKRLSDREKEVLLLVSDGKTTKEIAEELFVSSRTVETHRVNIMKKLKVQNTAELIKKAAHLKLI